MSLKIGRFKVSLGGLEVGYADDTSTPCRWALPRGNKFHHEVEFLVVNESVTWLHQNPTWTREKLTWLPTQSYVSPIKSGMACHVNIVLTDFIL